MALDLPTIAARAVKTAFQVSSSVLKDVTLSLKPGTGAYDVATGKRAASATSPITVKGLKYYDRKDAGKEEQAKTCSILIRQAEVLEKGYSEKINDVDNVTMEGVTWDISDVQTDPADAIYILKARRA